MIHSFLTDKICNLSPTFLKWLLRLNLLNKHLLITPGPYFFALHSNTEQNKHMTPIYASFQISRDLNSATKQLSVSPYFVHVCRHANIYTCVHARVSMCVCTVGGVITEWTYFHSSSVSPSKGTASVSIWMLLGSLLPTQPIGVRLKEGRQAMPFWYTTAGSGSFLVASAFGNWNFMNWLAFSKPP